LTISHLPTADLADGATRPIAMDARLRPVWRGARLVGPAFTVATEPGQILIVLEAVEQAPPGSVLVIDGGGRLERALYGDKLSRLGLERGLAGVVVDGAVRDVDETEKLGFPVFAAGTVPTPPLRETTGTIGGSVRCGGLTVEPGDFVYGDADGIVVVPEAEHAELAARVRGS
jgi:RraA family protein